MGSLNLFYKDVRKENKMIVGKLREYLRSIPDDTEVWIRIKNDVPLEDVLYIHNEELNVKYCVLSGEKNVKKFN